MSGSGREALSDVKEWSIAPPGRLRVVGSPSRMSRSGRESLPVVWKWLEGPPGCMEVVGSPSGCLGLVERLSRMSGSGQETLQDVQECLEALLVVREWLIDSLNV